MRELNAMKIIDPLDFHNAVQKLRFFFEKKGFIEVHTQSRLSVLAACEDPRTIATFNYAGNLWPLPQTGQMWLEYELLNNPNTPGYYCISTSFRNEPNPIAGRHDLVFPMFEFETKGNFDLLEILEKELIEFLGISTLDNIITKEYKELSIMYNVKELESNHEEEIWRDLGCAVLIKHFPQYTSPFWNMKKNDDCANKIDAILFGIETIGSAERSIDPDEMRELFHTISNGMYADILFAQFGKKRVENELEEFLKFDFFERCGGGIGITRLIRALKLSQINN